MCYFQAKRNDIPAERLLKKQKYLNRQSLLSERKSSVQARFENMQENW